MSRVIQKTAVMIAGIGGASLGTEVLKALQLTGTYEIYGCDISPTAYGLHQAGFAATFLVDRDDYVGKVLRACQEAGARYLIPGGEQPMSILSGAVNELEDANVTLVSNSREVVEGFSDKGETFRRLSAAGIPIPRTLSLESGADVQEIGLPCIIKPATGSGGSVSVFFARTAEEAAVYAEFIRRNGAVPVAQEYINDAEGEFTVGVLSLPDGHIVGSIALRRVLDAKLSVAYRGHGGVISSGYSQGYIDGFEGICAQAETIAAAVGSRGPINVQGRVRNGVLLPFEINPRFSASTYLRAMAGFNEVDLFLRYLISGEHCRGPEIRPGWYLRSLTEQYVAASGAGQ